MEIIFFILMVALEIALAILSCTRFAEKVKWLRNRALVRAIEFVLLLGIVLMPFTHMKWRYAGTLILIGILLLISGLCWLIKRRKAAGNVKKARVIVSAVLSVHMIAFALVPAFLFTNYNGLKTTGSYTVRESSAILIDENRVDTFETDGSMREVPVHFFYPDAEGSFPLVIFSHGAFGYYQSNYSTYAELASNGYVVASLDHPHHAFFTEDSDGKTVIVDFDFISRAVNFENNEMSLEQEYNQGKEWMRLRTADMNLVLDSIADAKISGALSNAWHTENNAEILSVLSMIDVEHIGVMGHSMGGATAVSVGRTRGDIDAVIVLDGTMLDELVGCENDTVLYNANPYPVPVLDFGKKEDYTESAEATDAYQIVNVNNYVIEHAKDGRSIRFSGVGHMDFTDLPFFSPFLSSMLGSENIDHEAFMNKVNGLVLNWFDYYLKGIGKLELNAEY